MFLADLTDFIKTTHKNFPWADDAIGQYLSWAFSRNCLFVESDENAPVNSLMTMFNTTFNIGTFAGQTTSNVVPSKFRIYKYKTA